VTTTSCRAIAVGYDSLFVVLASTTVARLRPPRSRPHPDDPLLALLVENGGTERPAELGAQLEV
jgi:hypothetical protein